MVATLQPLQPLHRLHPLQPPPVSTWTGREAVKQGRQINMESADFGVETRKPCGCKDQGRQTWTHGCQG